MLRIFLTNLGKYNEGMLIGEWVDLPCSDFESVFERIGVSDEPDENGIYYEESFITDYECDFESVHIGEYEDLDELNELAEALDGDNGEIVAALMDNDWSLSLSDAVSQANDVIVYSGCDDMSDVALRWYEETGQLAEVEKVISSDYIDWEAVGRNMDMCGTFLPISDGYIEVLG